MIAVDTNILVYAHRKDSPRHLAASTRIRELAEGAQDWAIPWPCVHEFFAITTHARIYSPASTTAQACWQLEAWMESPTLVLIGEGAGYWDKLSALARKAAVTGPRMHDARIAAICLLHGVRELWTADRDFSQFPALASRNPLSGA